jgi:AcrR family transcriptional regulator
MKEKVIEKAGDMFLKLGFKSVTMDDIANEMGISKKTLYKYFDNKDHLVDETVSFVQDTINDILCQIMDNNYNAIEENFVIKNVFKNMFKNAKSSPMYQLKKYYPETFAKLMDREIDTFSDCILNNLEKGIQEKLYRENVNKDLVMKLYFILVFGIHDSEFFRGLPLRDMIKIELKVLEYHTRAISTEKGRIILEKELTKYQIN